MRFLTFVVSVAAMLGLTVSCYGLTLDLVEGADDPIADLSAALLAPGSGVTIISGSESFIGRVGDGIDPNTAQSATYTGLNLVPNNPGLPTIANPDGIFLTSGVANIPFSNNDETFDHNSVVGVDAPGTGDDADLAALLGSTIRDVNFFEFEFTVEAGKTSVEADFVFGSDEFPDQTADIFGFFVDGVNYAFFPDGSLVSFDQTNAENFNDNDVGTNNYNLEYDGIFNSLHLVGMLDLNRTTHTLKIAIGDTTDDDILDSGVFIGNLNAGTNTTGGIDPDRVIPPPTPRGTVPEPVSSVLSMMGLAWLGAGLRRRRIA